MGLWIELFLVFMRIGFCSFGGLSMIPIIQDEMLSHTWMTMTEIADVIAIAEMTPGSLGINMATFVGLRTAGLGGAIFASLGVMVPSLTVCMAASMFLSKMKSSKLLSNALYGIRPACIGLIIAVALSLSHDNFIVTSQIAWMPLLIAALVGVLLFRFRLSIPKVILCAAVLGLILL